MQKVHAGDSGLVFDSHPRDFEEVTYCMDTGLLASGACRCGAMLRSTILEGQGSDRDGTVIRISKTSMISSMGVDNYYYDDEEDDSDSDSSSSDTDTGDEDSGDAADRMTATTAAIPVTTAGNGGDSGERFGRQRRFRWRQRRQRRQLGGSGSIKPNCSAQTEN